ncbi:MAG TPA: diaminopimelate decarboxylase [Candidatus Dormibacteraeota bacterium]|nr:diaminopimelate decarboxylase [Candidatus Dormibacteraeota bacterium]
MNERGHLEVGGCDLLDLAAEHGTPLYVYDETTVRGACRAFVGAAGGRADILYSAKAFSSPAFLRVVAEEGLGLDVVSAGELHLALRAGYPTERIDFLGNNKSRDDIAAAHRVGATLVVDGDHELDLIRQVVPEGGVIRCQVRVSPGIVPDTHDFISTGQLDSKFGFGVESGAAAGQVRDLIGEERIDLTGLHFHIGSQIFDLRGHVAALEVVLDLAAELRRDLGWTPRHLTAGGGLGIAYRPGDAPPAPAEFVETMLGALDEGCRRRRLPLPRLALEPGRSIAGPSAVALYTVGAIKDVPGVRRYVAVDGGMGDNPRPKLYGARYQVLYAADPERPPAADVTIAGKYCESTDILAEGAALPELRPGDLLCMPAAGAYQLTMASNYNGVPRPAAVMVAEGEARLIRRRETLDDLLRSEVF